MVHRGVLSMHCRVTDGTTPLIAAAENGQAGVVTLLLRAGAPAEYQRRSDGMSAMMAAASGGHDACVQALVATGVHVTDRTCMCMTALHFAAQAGSCSVVKRLVRAGAVVDARNARGATALMLASESGLCGVVGELLCSGANPGLTDFSGSTAAAIAMRKGNRSVLRKLLAAIAVASATAACMGESSSESLMHQDSGGDSDEEREAMWGTQMKGPLIPERSGLGVPLILAGDELCSRGAQEAHDDAAEYSFGNVFW